MTTNKSARQKQLERRPMKRSKKGNQSGLIKTAQLTRQTKRAGRKTYSTTKSKAQSAQAQTIEPENKTNGQQTTNQAITAPKSKKSFERNKLLIFKLLVSGTTDVADIALALGMAQPYCMKLVSKIREDVVSMSIDEYRSLLNSKLVQLLHNHTTSSSTLALELHKLDCQLDDIDASIVTLDHDADGASIIKQRASLASTRLTMLREQRDNNASLFSTLSKVGVSQVALNKKKEGSIPLPTNNKNSDLGASKLEVSNSSLASPEPGVTASILDISGYSGVSKADALAELKRSTKQMDRYLKGQEKEGGQDDNMG